MKEISSRIAYFDIAKGVLIILLVISHIASAEGRLSYENPYFNNLFNSFRLFRTFYMPAFFVISGLCSSFRKPPKPFFYGILRQLVIPLLVFGIISSALDDVLIYHNGIGHAIIRFLTHFDTLWFLQALIVSKLILYFLLRHVGNVSYILVLSLLMMAFGVYLDGHEIGPNVFFYKHGLIAFFFLTLGALLRERPELFEKLLKLSVVLFPLSTILSFKFYYAFAADIVVSLRSIPLFLFYSVTGSLFILFLARKIRESRFFEYWGRNSIVVYGLHFAPLFAAFKFYYELISPQTALAFSVFLLLLLVTECVICMGLIKLFEFRPFCYLIGRR